MREIERYLNIINNNTFALDMHTVTDGLDFDGLRADILLVVATSSTDFRFEKGVYHRRLSEARTS